MNFSHFRAILFRRWVLIKRSWKSVLFTLFATIFFDGLAIFAQYLISTLANEDVNPIRFSSYQGSQNKIILLINEGQETASQKYIDLIDDIYYNDTGKHPNFTICQDIDEVNHFLYNTKDVYDIGFWLRDVSKLDIPIFYNSTTGFGADAANTLLSAQVMVTRLKYNNYFHHDFEFSSITLWQRTLDRIFGQIGPMLITGSLISAIPLYISQPIIDTRGEVRSYMKSCTLSLSSYWAATFLMDFAFWIINSIAAWLILVLFRIQAILDNFWSVLYAFIMCGPSFIVFVYCCSFAFATADSASRNAFILICLFLLVPIIVDIVRNALNPIWLEWLYTFYPPIIVQRILMALLQNIGSMKQPLDYYFKNEQHQAYFIMQYGQTLVWFFILYLIEFFRTRLQEGSAKRTYSGYTEVFEEAKRKHQFTQEAKEMENKVLNFTPNNDKQGNKYAVRIVNVSRLFFNTAGKPVTAVNSVSLGIEENSIFGFLGANGAGKTTLIKMITSLLPVSNGFIEINGVDIAKFNDPTKLAICPQFNSHLCEEMTPKEHFHLYSLIHGLTKDEEKKRTEKLIKELDLEAFKDQPIRELSGGDVRKLSIALSFLGPAKIILLDEPTASLDPVARHHVHEMILSYKGQKTFMLCTHLLSEAEFLCDMISIMIKGCVYTCGTPSYLTQKFGTDFKIDIMLNDESPGAAHQVDQFFAKKLLSAVLSIIRPKARIYSIPATDISLPDLFTVMQNGQEEGNGYQYFTCSSSSLERVFMELVHMSENDEIMFANPV
ncbi:ABC transporter family protein [Tritrichomonas foetus]|uniref:ABC transporter family protein n=1 Tax=Tritrichomonas foetus TaxID=1144522 RepID=A0A1J4J238_9EUKA|nr:ABC transporter family protein [Tritrichomonas foetus]|eukprot:OHS92825.1 ABC transporter family protein [Tritrichomonas foetus]